MAEANAEIDQSVGANFWNPIFGDIEGEYRSQVRARLSDLFQDGVFIGQIPYRDHAREASELAKVVPALIAITQMPFDPSLEPRKQRAQQMLLRYAELTEKANANGNQAPA